MPRALVTGGAGFIGSNLAKALLARGYKVRIVDNYQRGSRVNFDPASSNDLCEIECGDLTDFQVAKRAVSGVDVVFDLAAQVCGITELHRMPADLMYNNIGITRNVAIASMLERARVVYGSSSCVYDFEGAVVPHIENQKGVPSTYYGWSKLVGERMYAACADQEDTFSYAIARIFNTYGPKESLVSPHVIPQFIQNAFGCREGNHTFRILGSGEQTRAFTYVEDIVEALIMLGQSDVQGEAINLGSPQETKILDLARLILELMGVEVRKIDFLFVPAHPLDVKHRAASIERAKNLLVWEPRTDLRHGLMNTIRWFDPVAHMKSVSSLPS